MWQWRDERKVELLMASGLRSWWWFELLGYWQCGFLIETGVVWG
jgi:hypothetical protein